MRLGILPLDHGELFAKEGGKSNGKPALSLNLCSGLRLGNQERRNWDVSVFLRCHAPWQNAKLLPENYIHEQITTVQGHVGEVPERPSWKTQEWTCFELASSFESFLFG